MKLYLPLILLCLLFNSAHGGNPEELPDQYGNHLGLESFAAQPVLVIIASTRKTRHIGRWERVLRSDIPDLNSLPVVDVTEDPKPTLQQVADMLQRRAPENASILIDLNNSWASHFELDTAEPCLLLLNSQHEIVARFRGRPKKKLVEEVLTASQEYFPAQSVPQ